MHWLSVLLDHRMPQRQAGGYTANPLVTFTFAKPEQTAEAGMSTINICVLFGYESISPIIAVTAADDKVANDAAIVSTDNVDPYLTNNPSMIEAMISQAFYYFYLPIV